jgi:tetratricopeptide (TPR) repeat protein
MAWMNLAALLDDAGNYAEACKLYRVADERFRRVFALDHPYLHSPMTRLAKLLDKMGDHEAAEPLWRQVAAETRQAFPPGHSHHRLVAAKTAGLGRCLRDLQRCPEAEVLLLESYEQFHTAGGARHKDTLAGAEALVRLYEQCGPAEKATEFRQILATTDAELPDRAVSNTRP